MKKNITSYRCSAPDDKLFRHLATIYASSHEVMRKGKPCPGDNDKFPGGITNGAHWSERKG